MIVRCTQRARTRLRLKAADLSDPGTPPDTLSEWYCNVVVLDRRPYFLLTHARTLFAVWMPVAGNTAREAFFRSMREHARAALIANGVDARAAERALNGTPDRFTKTMDRRILGSMLDYAHMARHIVEYDGGMARLGLERLTRHINRSPMSVIGMESPEREVRRVLGASGADDGHPPAGSNGSRPAR